MFRERYDSRFKAKVHLSPPSQRGRRAVSYSYSFSTSLFSTVISTRRLI